MSDSTPLFQPDTEGSTVAFTVSRVRGVEEMNRPFRFELDLASTVEVEFSNVIQQPFTLTLRYSDAGGNGGELSRETFAGIVSDLRLISGDAGSGDTLYRATLVPKHWLLGLSRRSRVFSNTRIDEIARALLCDVYTAQQIDIGAGLTLQEDVVGEERMSQRYAWRDFTAQYQESDLDFLHRLLEAEGIYYFTKSVTIEATAGEPEHDIDVLYFADAKENEGMTEQAISYHPVANIPTTKTYVSAFELCHRIIPNTFHVRDFDYGAYNAAEDKTECAPSNADATGTIGDRWGTHSEHGRFAVNDKGFEKVTSGDTTSEAAETPPDPDRTSQIGRAARIRVEEALCRQRVLEGASTEPKFRPGLPIKLKDTTKDDPEEEGDPPNERKYLLTRVVHTYENANYTNRFEAIPRDVQYRPPRTTPVPRVHGVMSARVKGVGDNQPGSSGSDDLPDPYIDAEGRYRVRFAYEDSPDDVSVSGPDALDRDPSPPIRLAQPYAGKDYGIHFPSMPGTEMVFACIDGDPDRPIGLGVVPTVELHSPVPNKALDLKTQNPWADALAVDNEGFNSTDAFYFDAKKNVIRSKLGHQIVMDDNNGGSNVGITIQTGKKDNSMGKNIYWFSRIDMGGYRVKSGVEQVIDGMTEVIGYLTTLASRELTQFTSLAFAIGASTAEAGNYLSDTYGNTTPVGITARTDQAVTINGAKGVNIISPNLFGQFSGGFVGDDATQKSNQHYVEQIAKAINAIVLQEIVGTTVDELKEFKELVEKEKKHPKRKAFFKWKKNVKKQRVNSLIYTVLQRSGVNIHSAGELKMTSLQSSTLFSGFGGTLIRSLGNIEQKADKGFDIEAHQGISIATKGSAYTKGNGIEKALDVVGELFPPLVTLIRGAINIPEDDPEVKHYPLALSNELGDITIRTGDDKGKGKGDVFISTDGGGNVKAFSETGHVELWSGGNEILLETGSRNGLEDDDKVAPLKKDKATARIKVGEKDVEVFGKEKVTVGVGADFEKIDDDRHLVIESDKIELTCGDSSLVLNHDGTITLKGKAIEIKTEGGDLELSSSGKLSAQAVADMDLGGMNVTIMADAKGELTGQIVNLEGQMNTVKGSMIKIGP